MLGISILGLLAALSIPAILGAYTKAQEKGKANNIAAVEKAKGVLTLPRELGMAGAMSLTTNQPFDETVINNLCSAMRISDLSALTVGNVPITPGDLAVKAYYE